MLKKALLVGTIVAIIAFLATQSFAKPGYVDSIPNGQKFSCSTCHDGKGLGPFGKHFKANGKKWNRRLAKKNSDGDRKKNGKELKDRKGKWRPGDPDPGKPKKVTNPNDKQSP